MRRDMQEVLERWGRWAAGEEHCSRVDWPAMCVFARYKPARCLPGCTDADGRAIDTCVAHMSMVRSAGDILIVGLRFLEGRTTRFIAEGMAIPRMRVRASLNASEGFLEGCMVAMGIRLDMDPVVVLPAPPLRAPKNLCYASSI